jgi:ATP-dependent Lon protease
MNTKGFAGFVLILSILALLLFFSVQLNLNKERLNETKNELIKAEISNKERTIIENNVDKIIKTKLNEQINSNNFNTQTAKNSINKAIANYLNKKAKVYTATEQTQVTQNFLNQNSSVQLLKSEYFIYAQYVYLPNNIASKIKQPLGENLITEFIFQTDYTKTIIKAV